MKRIFLQITELAQMRHIIIDGIHVINTAAPSGKSNIYYVLKQQDNKKEPQRENEKA